MDKRRLQKIRRSMLDDHPHCHYCNKKVHLGNSTCDHVIPRSQGGSNKQNNLVLSCSFCNELKGTIPQEEFIKNYSVYLFRHKQRKLRKEQIKAKEKRLIYNGKEWVAR